jgi:hypothetical protein
MNFNTKGHEVKTGGYTSPYIKPGIQVAKIVEVSYHQSAGGTPGVKFFLEGKPMEELEGKGQTNETTYWLSPKAWEYTKDKLCVMADVLGVREALDSVDASSAEEYCAALNGIFGGKAARWKFSGEEIEGKMDEETGERKSNWFKASIATYDFIEKASVSDEETKLKFDENNKYDMKRLATADVEMADDPLATADADEEPWA